MLRTMKARIHFYVILLAILVPACYNVPRLKETIRFYFTHFVVIYRSSSTPFFFSLQFFSFFPSHHLQILIPSHLLFLPFLYIFFPFPSLIYLHPFPSSFPFVFILFPFLPISPVQPSLPPFHSSASPCIPPTSPSYLSFLLSPFLNTLPPIPPSPSVLPSFVLFLHLSFFSVYVTRSTFVLSPFVVVVLLPRVFVY